MAFCSSASSAIEPRPKSANFFSAAATYVDSLEASLTDEDCVEHYDTAWIRVCRHRFAPSPRHIRNPGLLSLIRNVGREALEAVPSLANPLPKTGDDLDP